MKGPIHRLDRAASTLIGVALLSGAAMVGTALVGLTPPAQAAPSLGTLALAPATGTVDDVPAFTATTSAACPTGWGAQAQIRISPADQSGRPTGGTLDRIASDTGYDSAPFTLTTNRSIAKALDPDDRDAVIPAPADGDYRITIECMTELAEAHVDWFQTVITISGPNWQVRDEPTASPGPSGSSTPTGTPTATPTATTSPTSSPTPTATASPTPTATASPTPTPTGTASPTPTSTGTASPTPSRTTSTPTGGGGGDLALTGTSMPMLLTGGTVLILTGAAAMVLARRRDTPQG
ncbi:hypothetical protein ACN28C_07340 [Plantactinospora sp. WMMC1484]|uniref:hypothetical protein n=1 Tax=Plantactinospora sp. WMMC1484 TaxID=3404122 RepID=UPI003BF59FC8